MKHTAALWLSLPAVLFFGTVVQAGDPKHDLPPCSGNFCQIHQVGSLVCGANEVMIGIHIGQGKALCAGLTNNDSVSNSLTDAGPNGHQVSSDPSMHGCPTGYFIQGVTVTTGLFAANNEILKCVAFKSPNGSLVSSGSCVRNNAGATQSTVYGFDNPSMHACPSGTAMVGIHQKRNDLYCCD